MTNSVNNKNLPIELWNEVFKNVDPITLTKLTTSIQKSWNAISWPAWQHHFKKTLKINKSLVNLQNSPHTLFFSTLDKEEALKTFLSKEYKRVLSSNHCYPLIQPSNGIFSKNCFFLNSKTSLWIFENPKTQDFIFEKDTYPSLYKSTLFKIGDLPIDGPVRSFVANKDLFALSEAYQVHIFSCSKEEKTFSYETETAIESLSLNEDWCIVNLENKEALIFYHDKENNSYTLLSLPNPTLIASGKGEFLCFIDTKKRNLHLKNLSNNFSLEIPIEIDSPSTLYFDGSWIVVGSNEGELIIYKALETTKNVPFIEKAFEFQEETLGKLTHILIEGTVLVASGEGIPHENGGQLNRGLTLIFDLLKGEEIQRNSDKQLNLTQGFRTRSLGVNSEGVYQIMEKTGSIKSDILVYYPNSDS